MAWLKLHFRALICIGNRPKADDPIYKQLLVKICEYLRWNDPNLKVLEYGSKRQGSGRLYRSRQLIRYREKNQVTWKTLSINKKREHWAWKEGWRLLGEYWLRFVFSRLQLRGEETWQARKSGESWEERTRGTGSYLNGGQSGLLREIRFSLRPSGQ